MYKVKLDGLRYGKLNCSDERNFIECCDVECDSNVKCENCIFVHKGRDRSQLEIEEF